MGWLLILRKSTNARDKRTSNRCAQRQRVSIDHVGRNAVEHSSEAQQHAKQHRIWRQHIHRAGSLGAVEEVDDSPGEFKSLRFVLSGVPSDTIAIARSESIRNKAVTVSLAILDPDTHAVLDAPVVWTDRKSTRL